MSNEKKPVLTCLKQITLASLADFGAYIPLAIFAAAALEYHKAIRFLVAYGILAVLYGFFLYRFRMCQRISTYVSHGNVMDWKAELLGFLRADGKIMLMIYGILAAAYELSIFVLNGAPQNPVGLVCSFPLGAYWVDFPVPVLRAVLAFVYATVVLCGLELFRSYRIHGDDLSANARRRER